MRLLVPGYLFLIIAVSWRRPQDVAAAAVPQPQDRVSEIKREKTQMANDRKEKKKEQKQEQKKVRKRKSTASKLSEEDVCVLARHSLMVNHRCLPYKPHRGDPVFGAQSPSLAEQNTQG